MRQTGSHTKIELPSGLAYLGDYISRARDSLVINLATDQKTTKPMKVPQKD